MPKLDHRKSTTGCIRCKQRKVKCDEARPSCTACSRHGVQCDFPAPKVRTSRPSATSDSRLEPYGALSDSVIVAPLPRQDRGASELELRLFHYFLSHTRYGLREEDEFWGIRAPLIAFEHRAVFHGMIAVAALHMYRQILDETFVFNGPANSPSSQTACMLREQFLNGRTSAEVYEVYLNYFDAAVKGQHELMREGDLKAAYVSSALLSVMSLFSLGIEIPNGREADLEAADSRLWFTLAIGPRELIPLWIQRSGAGILHEFGVYNDTPDFQDVEELFNARYAVPFQGLLQFGAEFETITPEEALAYQQALSYIGLIYYNLVGRLEDPLATSRRYVALPGRTPPLFSDMVLQQRHRALAILGYAFALMRLLEHDVPWYRGIAAKQVSAIASVLPPAWQQAMKWPRALLMVSPTERASIPDPTSIEYRIAT